MSWTLGLSLFAAAMGAGVTLVAGALLMSWAMPASHAAPTVAPEAIRDVPAAYLRLYEAAADRYGLDWAVLAAIGKVECDHGRDPDPSCTREGMTNSAGAGGPAQFLASTWARYGVSSTGRGTPDRWNASDAIFAMAHYLRASGAPGDYPGAIFAYNRASWYVQEVLDWAARYRGPTVVPDRGLTNVIAGQIATLLPGNGHVALPPADAPVDVQAMILAGNQLQDLPYGAAGHPDPRGASSEDCSSTVNYVLWSAGVRPIDEIVRQNPLAQSYVGYGLPGRGRWVTIYATTTPTDHVFIVIAGLRLDTSHNGTDVGPNRLQDGPRWRILSSLPNWAPWSVRHPPGL